MALSCCPAGSFVAPPAGDYNPAMRKWLARLSFSFLIVAGVLVWEGYKLIQSPRPGQGWRIALCFIGAGVCFGLSLRGVRERHRSQETDDQPPDEPRP